MPALDRYNNNLATPQAPGTGCHGWIMSTANLGIIAKLSGEQIFSGIRQSIPQGSRRIPDKEINDAIHKAKQDFDGGTFTPRPRPAPVVKDGKAARQKIINQATIKTEADLWESSPIRLHDEPAKDSPLLLKTLHDEDAFIWTGDRHEPGTAKNILPVCELIENYNAGKQPSTFIIPNRLSGLPAPKKNGEGITYRGDSNVAAFKYCIAEFDTISREDQIKFWSAVKLPIVALIDSGGKSIHAWIDVQKLAKVETLAQWQTEIKNRLYDQILIPLEVDAACSNPARLSRLPGHYRTEKAAFQRLLWLSAEGRSII